MTTFPNSCCEVPQVLHEAIEVRPSPTSGFGLFATRTIAEGAVVWYEESPPPLIHRDALAAMSPDRQEFYSHFAFQIDDEWFSGPPEGSEPEPADYMNHSCDPTVWFVDVWTMTARRTILPGEEITYDYATSESAPEFRIDACNCGTAHCRGVITHTDYLDRPELQVRYGDHVLPYLRRALAVRLAGRAPEPV